MFWQAEAEEEVDSDDNNRKLKTVRASQFRVHLCVFEIINYRAIVSGRDGTGRRKEWKWI